MCEPANIRIDYKRGFVFANKKRIAEWTTNDNNDRLEINKDGLTDAGINVDLDKLHDAVVELMQQ